LFCGKTYDISGRIFQCASKECAVNWNVLFMSVRLIWSMVLFKSVISLFITLPDDLAIAESGLLKSSAIILLLFISSFLYINI
jgi:hypothetical protein